MESNLNWCLGPPAAEETLLIMQALLNERLSDGYKRIWVQGSSRGGLCFTIFENIGGYTMRFFNTGGLRQFRVDEPLESEMVAMERLLEIFRQGVLSEFID
jgi:hypothetical protein